MIEILAVHSNAVWSSMYGIVCTRPDISQAVNTVSRYTVNPSKIQWQPMKLILQYLRGTLDIGLVCDRGNDIGSNVIKYVDSDYADDLDKRRSLTSYVSILSRCAIRWKSDISVDNCFVHYSCRVYGNNKGNERINLVKIFGQ